MEISLEKEFELEGFFNENSRARVRVSQLISKILISEIRI